MAALWLKICLGVLRTKKYQVRSILLDLGFSAFAIRSAIKLPLPSRRF